MPFYLYMCESCGEEFELFLRMADNKKPEGDACPKCGVAGSVKQVINCHFERMAPDQLGRVKPHSDWRNFLQELKRKNPGSDFNTY